jgi:sugar/nucleoside kinase (ribokinase family)
MPLTKAYDLSVISSAGFDRRTRVSRLLLDGRADRLAEFPARPSGLAALGLTAARCLLPGSRLALGTLLGDDAPADAFRAEMTRRGIDTTFALRVPGGTTRRQRVIEAGPDRKFIINQGGVSFAYDLTPAGRRQFKGLAARSRGLVLARLPVELTADLLDWAPRVGTFAALAPGGEQLGALADFRADLLVLNYDEAVAATRARPGDPPARVFARLLALSPAARVVQTGGGEHPAYFADRKRRRGGALEPAALGPISRTIATAPTGLGAGDVTAVALARCLVEGAALELAMRWARLLATAHLFGVVFRTRREAVAWYAARHAAFVPRRAASPKAA